MQHRRDVVKVFVARVAERDRDIDEDQALPGDDRRLVAHGVAHGRWLQIDHGLEALRRKAGERRGAGLPRRDQVGRNLDPVRHAHSHGLRMSRGSGDSQQGQGGVAP